MEEEGGVLHAISHAMMQTLDYSFELSTVNVADNHLHVDRNTKKKQ